MTATAAIAIATTPSTTTTTAISTSSLPTITTILETTVSTTSVSTTATTLTVVQPTAPTESLTITISETTTPIASATSSTTTTASAAVTTTTTTTTTAATGADLRLSKTVSPDPVPPGGVLTYGFTVANDGPHQAVNVRLTDVLPAGVSFQNFDFVSCSGRAGMDFPTRTLTWCHGTLASGASANCTIVLSAGSDLADGTVLSNTAPVGSDTIDPDPDDNSATAETTVGSN